MSLLFVIAMKYIYRFLTIKLPNNFRFHKGYKVFKLNHLCFVDNLFLFGHRNSESGLGEALRYFEHVLRLHVNEAKSSKFFARVPISKNQ